MRMLLVSSGIAWLDGEMGGWPSAGVVAVIGGPGTGKTSLALQSTLAALRRGAACFVTNDMPEAVVETSREWLEQDITPYLGDRLTLLGFAPFFVNKVRSRRAVDAPLSELGRLIEERDVRHVVFDTLDPILTWLDPAETAAATRSIVRTMNAWGVTVVCTLRAATAATAELTRAAGACIGLHDGEIHLRHAAWCSSHDRFARAQLVQGRGVVASGDDAAVPASTQSPDPSATPTESGPQSTPWTSLVTDARRLLGADEQEWEALSRDVFSTDASER